VADPLCWSQGSASSLLRQSPIFNNYQYVSGSGWNTQYEDYFQRANSGTPDENWEMELRARGFPTDYPGHDEIARFPKNSV
jgi:hypothetical protein